MNRLRILIEKYLLQLTVFLIPTQLAFHFWPTWSYVFGIRVDYLAPAFYLTDALVLFLVTSNLKFFKKYLRPIFLVLVLALFNTLFSSAPVVSLFRWFRIIELLFFGLYIFQQEVLKKESMYRTLIYSAAFFAFIGMVQFLTGKTLGGLFYFLGERSFNSLTPGIALVRIFGQDFLRAYSTFSHPNSMAGFLGVVTILIFAVPKKLRVGFTEISLIMIGLLVSFSLSAWVGILLVTLTWTFRNKKFFNGLIMAALLAFIVASLSLPMFSQRLLSSGISFPQNLEQRMDLSYISGKMISRKFFLGEGLNTFIINTPGLRATTSYLWFLQPVHNIFLLALSETGIAGLVLLSLVIYLALRKSIQLGKTELVLALLFIVITGTTDHYWLTLQQNLLLFSLLVGLSFRRIS